MAKRVWQRIFVRDNVLKEIKKIIEKHKNSKHIIHHIFKESYTLKRRMRTKSKDFLKLKDIFYIFAKELEETTGIKVNYFTFRKAFYEFVKKDSI